METPAALPVPSMAPTSNPPMAANAFVEPLARTSSKPPPPPRPSLPIPEAADPSQPGAPAVPFNPSGVFRKPATPINGTSKAATITASDRPKSVSEPPPPLLPEDQSGSMPVFTGVSRRSTVVAGVLVFALAAVAGFWGVRSLMGFLPGQSEKGSAVPPIVENSPEPSKSAVPSLEPLNDPAIPTEVRTLPSSTPSRWPGQRARPISACAGITPRRS